MQFRSNNHRGQIQYNAALFMGANEERRLLKIAFDETELVVSINKKLIPPISWFLTDELGEFVTMGQISDQSFKINLSGLYSGIYILRIAGEVITINHRV